MKSQPTALPNESRATNEAVSGISGDSLDSLRATALQTSNSTLALQRRAEEELLEAKQALEKRTEELAGLVSLLSATLESTADGMVA